MAGAPTAAGVLGAYLIAILISILLYGISIAQAYVYWLHSATDKLYLKTIVWVVMLLETIHTIFTIHLTYHYIILSFGDLQAVGTIVWSAGICIISGVLGASLVHLFYLRRIWILGQRNKILVIVPSFVLLGRVGFGLASGSLMYRLHTWAEFRNPGPLATLSTGSALSALMDLMVASILIFFLARSRTGFEETDHIIQKLMAYAVNTGAITMICQLAVVFLFVLSTHSLVFAGVYLMVSKLYANSLLGSLNTRQFLRKEQYESKVSGMKFRTVNTGAQSHPIEINQHTSDMTDGTGSTSYELKKVDESTKSLGLVHV